MVNKILSPPVGRWSIAFAQHNNFSKSLWRYKEIKNPRGRFLADPFVYQKDDEDYIFTEDLFLSDNKGRISVIRIENESYEFLGVVLEEEFHLSYPFIFDHGGDIFMVPETHASKDIRTGYISREKGFGFLDVHELTDRGDGFSNGIWHIDQFHLSPDGVIEAWSNHITSY